MHFVFALLWAGVGLFLRHCLKSARECELQAPRAYALVGEVAVAVCLAIWLSALSVAMVFCIHRRMGALHRLWSSSGPLQRELLQEILEEATVPYHVVAGVECSICLQESASEGGEASRWRRLGCGHSFHEQCLIEWWRRARQCPLCRLNVQ